MANKNEKKTKKIVEHLLFTFSPATKRMELFFFNFFDDLKATEKRVRSVRLSGAHVNTYEYAVCALLFGQCCADGIWP